MIFLAAALEIMRSPFAKRSSGSPGKPLNNTILIVGFSVDKSLCEWLEFPDGEAAFRVDDARRGSERKSGSSSLIGKERAMRKAIVAAFVVMGMTLSFAGCGGSSEPEKAPKKEMPSGPPPKTAPAPAEK